MDRDLLEPSLQRDESRAIHSGGAMLAAAFFGGGIGVTALAMENARLLGRLRRDAPWLVLGVLACVATLIVTLEWVGFASEYEARVNLRIAYRGAGFGLWAAFYALHRRQHRAMHTFGRKASGQVRAAVAASLFGWMCFMVFVRIYEHAGGLV